MNRRFWVPALTCILLLTGFSLSQVAKSQSAQSQSTPSTHNTTMTDPSSNFTFEQWQATDFDPNSLPVHNSESDPVVEARNIEREFRDIDLIPQQLEQVKQIRRQFNTGMIDAVRTNFAQLMMAMFLPQKQAESLLGNVLGNPIQSYGQQLSQLLTPAQLEIWQRNTQAMAQQPPEQ